VDQILTNLFDMTEPWPEKIIRSIAIYLFVYVALRVAGKRELGHASTADLIVLLLISNTVQNAIIGDDTTLIGGLIGATVLFVLNKGIVQWGYRSHRFTRLVEGIPCDLIRDGEVLDDMLSREKITMQELAAACREQGVADFAAVRRAVLETNGTISIIPKDPADPIAERLAQVEASLQELLRRSETGLARQN
jgi:uncharacterized membrane protein YcaP (DUF421 family)